MNVVVETIHEGLKNDRVVKVKGFGTFKLTAVRERESINVNTGERVVISSHDKVSFTPDAVLRDLVNKPFAQFDTVVLADGVDFEDMPEVETEDGDVVAEVETEIPAPVQEEAKVVPLPVMTPVVEPEPEPQSEPEPQVEEPVIEEPVAEEPEPVVEEVVVEEPVAEEPQPEEPESLENADVPVMPDVPEYPEIPETPETPESPSQEEQEEDQQEEETPDYISEFYDDENSECKKVFLIYAIVVNVIVAALFFVFGYYARSTNMLGIESDDKPVVETPAEPVADQLDTTKQKTAESETPAKATEETAVEKKEESKSEEKKPVAEPKKEEKSEAKAESTSKYDSDPRVRTGAYRIVGVANTITVKSGQTLKAISKTYLGAGMECYVEVFNGGITEVKEGQTIKIPKLELKKKGTKAKK